MGTELLARIGIYTVCMIQKKQYNTNNEYKYKLILHFCKQTRAIKKSIIEFKNNDVK
jgi:hypothetical protein